MCLEEMISYAENDEYEVWFKSLIIELNNMKKDKQLEQLLFEIYEKGIMQKDCNLTEAIEKNKEIITKISLKYVSNNRNIRQRKV